jgi:hypothetical protein
LPGLAFNALSLPPCSLSAVASASSGLVLLGLKAASELATASSDPDFEYSVERGTSESLSCASFWAKRVGVVLIKRGVKVEGRAAGVRRWRARRGWMRNIFVGCSGFVLGCTFGDQGCPTTQLDRERVWEEVYFVWGKGEALRCTTEAVILVRAG